MNECLFEEALKILPGLLASGHYTVDANDSDADEVGTAVIGSDNGKDWKEYSYQKYSSLAIADAISLASELHRAVEHYQKTEAEPL